jgi:hypothetical protein
MWPARCMVGGCRAGGQEQGLPPTCVRGSQRARGDLGIPPQLLAPLKLVGVLVPPVWNGVSGCIVTQCDLM